MTLRCSDSNHVKISAITVVRHRCALILQQSQIDRRPSGIKREDLRDRVQYNPVLVTVKKKKKEKENRSKIKKTKKKKKKNGSTVEKERESTVQLQYYPSSISSSNEI